MSISRVYPSADAFIYKDGTVNTGRDEILELGSFTGNVEAVPSRILMKFPSGMKEGNYTLHLYDADAANLPENFTVDLYPILEEWEEGIGKFRDAAVSEGVTWENRKSDTPWTVAGGTTGSLITSQVITKNASKDLNFNIPTGQTSEYGYLIKLHQEDSDAHLDYFGVDSHTIFKPFIEIGVEDSIHTGSLDTISTDKRYLVNMVDLQKEYCITDEVQLRFDIRNLYPERIFTTSSLYREQFIFPVTSYWGIKDEYTNNMVVDFSPYTQISSDETGSFFNIDMSMLEPERYYRLLVNVVTEDVDRVYDNKMIFKVIRNGRN